MICEIQKKMFFKLWNEKEVKMIKLQALKKAVMMPLLFCFLPCQKQTQKYINKFCSLLCSFLFTFLVSLCWFAYLCLKQKFFSVSLLSNFLFLFQFFHFFPLLPSNMSKPPKYECVL